MQNFTNHSFGPIVFELLASEEGELDRLPGLLIYQFERIEIEGRNEL